MKCRHLVLAAVLLADLLSKILALRFLPHDAATNAGSRLDLFWVLNDTGTNSLMSGAENVGSFVSRLLAECALIVIVLVLNRRRAGRRTKALAYAVFGAVASIFFFFMRRFTASLPVGGILLGLGNRLPLAALAYLFAQYSKDPAYSILWSAYCGAVLGNTLGLLYPPFAIVDFIPFNFSPVLDIAGIGNIADAVEASSLAAMAIYAPVFFAKTLKRGIFREDEDR